MYIYTYYIYIEVVIFTLGTVKTDKFVYLLNPLCITYYSVYHHHHLLLLIIIKKYKKYKIKYRLVPSVFII